MSAVTELFCERSKIVGSKIVHAKNLDEVIDCVIKLCEEKAPCTLLANEPGTEKGPLNARNLPTRLNRLLAAPGLKEGDHAELGTKLAEKLEKACVEKDFVFLEEGLRSRMSGIDVGFVIADVSIAGSGTCLINSNNEEKRLSTMISEICVFLVKESTIYEDILEIAPILRKMQEKPSYNAMISGPSRTADIERLPAVGVHGPLEQYIIILEEENHA